MQYGLYGPHSPATNILSAAELKALRSEVLLKRLRDLNRHEHTILYYGPAGKDEAIAEINRYHRVPDALMAVEKKKVFPFRETPKNQVRAVRTFCLSVGYLV